MVAHAPDATVKVKLAESSIAAIRQGMGIGMVPLYAPIAGLRD